MKETLKLKILAIITLIYVAFFTKLAFQIRNYEFLYYSVLVYVGVIGILFVYKDKIALKFKHYLLISIAWFFNSLGSNVYIGMARIYDMWFFGLRYDQFMHALGSFLIALVIYSLFEKYLTKALKQNKPLFFSTLVIITLGIGAFYEIIELFAVAFFDAGSKVGTYFNNALDLVFNFIGASIAATYLIKKSK
jgi:hypothetical protein